MAAQQLSDDLVTTLDRSVEAGLAHFRRLDAEAKIEMGQWGPRETLCHLTWWHQATIEGMESVAAGGAPYRIYATADEMNARAVGRQSGQTVSQLANKVTQSHARILTVARALPDAQVTVFVHGDGSEDSVQQRVEVIIRHWNACTEELQAV